MNEKYCVGRNSYGEKIYNYSNLSKEDERTIYKRDKEEFERYASSYISEIGGFLSESEKNAAARNYYGFP